LPENASNITEKQIHDALWNYYYDVEKTVGYLVKINVTKAKKEPKKAMGNKVTGWCNLFYTEVEIRGFYLAGMKSSGLEGGGSSFVISRSWK